MDFCVTVPSGARWGFSPLCASHSLIGHRDEVCGLALQHALQSNSARGWRFVSGTPLTHRALAFSEGEEGLRGALRAQRVCGERSEPTGARRDR